MPKPVCAKCNLFYKPEKNGVWWVEGMPDGLGGWKPYKIWSGDLWKCAGCDNEIIVGHGQKPLRIQHERDFKLVMDAIKPTIQVNDC